MRNNTGDVSGGIADLLPLALNPPGTTATHALGLNSQALDAIPPGTTGCGTTITTDQRGVDRPQGSGCDIGVYESAASSDTVTPDRAIFADRFTILGVTVGSLASPDATLFLTVPGCMTDAPMRWSGNFYYVVKRVLACGNLHGQTATGAPSHGGGAAATIQRHAGGTLPRASG